MAGRAPTLTSEMSEVLDRGLAGDRDDIGFTSVGEVGLKGLSAPIEAYEAFASPSSV